MTQEFEDYLRGLTAEEIQEISANHVRYYENSTPYTGPEELIDSFKAFESTGYTAEDAKADGLSYEEYVFWWRQL